MATKVAWLGWGYKLSTPETSEIGKVVPGQLVQRLPHTDLLPSEMDDGHVIVNPKPGKDASRAGNLCHINLLSATSNVFERRLRDHLERLDVLNPGSSVSVHRIPRLLSSITDETGGIRNVLRLPGQTDDRDLSRFREGFLTGLA